MRKLYPVWNFNSCVWGGLKRSSEKLALFQTTFSVKSIGSPWSKDIRASAKPYSYNPETDLLLKISPEPTASPKRSPNWFITNSTILARRLPRTMQKAKPYGQRNTKHGAGSVTKPFQTASKSISRSASKVSIMTEKAGCTTTVSGITTLKSGGLWVRIRLGWWAEWICLSMRQIRRYGSIHWG